VNEKKRPMGYRTPTQEMHEALEEIQGLLEKEQANWVKIRRFAMARGAEVIATVNKSIAEGKAKPMSLMFRGNVICYISLVTIIAKLGEELVTSYKRLADVEESIKELSRRMK